MIPICKHCQKSKVNRPRGLCWSCYYTPGVKELFPSTSKYARRGVGNFTGNAPLSPEPTTAEMMRLIAVKSSSVARRMWIGVTCDSSTNRGPGQGNAASRPGRAPGRR